MINNSEKLIQALTEIKAVANNDSWFRDDPHRWAIASLPLAYAVACVEVIAKSSEKAGLIYNELIEGWAKPGIKALYEVVIAELPESELEKIKQALLHPENELMPDQKGKGS